MSSDSTAGGAGVADLLSVFTYSSVASVVVSVFRLAKVSVLGCPNCDEQQISEIILCLCVLYIIVSILSCVVIVKSLYIRLTYKPWNNL